MPGIEDYTAPSTENYAVGLPIVYFDDGSGERDIGNIAGAGIEPAITYLEHFTSRSGVRLKDKSVAVEKAVNITVTFDELNADNLKHFFMSNTLITHAAAVVSVVNEVFSISAYSTVWTALDYTDISSVSVELGSIDAEAVGTGTGASGEEWGDFTLDFAPQSPADITSLTVATTPFVALGDGGAGTASFEVEIICGNTPTGGNMRFFINGSADNVTGAILATYKPSWDGTENTDFSVDYSGGRIRRISGGVDHEVIRDNQNLLIDYMYQTGDEKRIYPMKSDVVEGSARIVFEPEVGNPMQWTIHKCNIRPEGSLDFNAEDWMTADFVLEILADITDNPGHPYGHIGIGGSYA